MHEIWRYYIMGIEMIFNTLWPSHTITLRTRKYTYGLNHSNGSQDNSCRPNLCLILDCDQYLKWSGYINTPNWSISDWFQLQGSRQKCISKKEDLTHWGRVTHICVSKKTIIGSDNGLPPGRHQAIIWTNAGLLLIGTLGTNFSEILIKIRIFSFKKMGFNVSSAKWRPFCLGLNVLSMCQNTKPLVNDMLILIWFIIDCAFLTWLKCICHTEMAAKRTLAWQCTHLDTNIENIQIGNLPVK